MLSQFGFSLVLEAQLTNTTTEDWVETIKNYIEEIGLGINDVKL